MLHFLLFNKIISVHILMFIEHSLRVFIEAVIIINDETYRG